jgi:hypothetical protein
MTSNELIRVLGSDGCGYGFLGERRADLERMCHRRMQRLGIEFVFQAADHDGRNTVAYEVSQGSAFAHELVDADKDCECLDSQNAIVPFVILSSMRRIFRLLSPLPAHPPKPPFAVETFNRISEIDIHIEGAATGQQSPDHADDLPEISSKGPPISSPHELVFVFKNGEASHRNNVQLGQYGRNRTNVYKLAERGGFEPPIELLTL